MHFHGTFCHVEVISPVKHVQLPLGFPCSTLDPKEGCEVPSPLVALLLTHGANVHRCDARGKTPLMHVRDAKILDGFLCWQHVPKKKASIQAIVEIFDMNMFQQTCGQKTSKIVQKKDGILKISSNSKVKKKLPGMVQFYTKYSRKGLCKAGETWQTGGSDGPLLLKPFFGWCKSTSVETQLNMKP